MTIGALSRATRIPVETLRTWERRYGSPMPIRKPSGHRLYPVESVEQLRRVSQLLLRGHRPQEIVGLSLSELNAMSAISESTYSTSDPRESQEPVTGVALDRSLDLMVKAATLLDREPLMRELRENWSKLGPLRCLEACVGAFMTRIGTAWHDRALDIRHEHFATACVEDFLREVREPYARQAHGPVVAAATLPGDAHEGGLLMAASLMTVRGCRVLYLGVGVPVDQMSQVVRAGNAEIVALSVSAAMPAANATRALTRLRAALPRRTPLWIGGSGAPARVKGTERFDSLTALDARLASLL